MPQYPSKSYKKLYATKAWSIMRRRQLAAEPLCRFCLRDGIYESAVVVDHIKRHRGDPALFFDADNVQSLCKSCHDSTKKSIENLHDRWEVDADGWLIRPKPGK